MAALNAGGSYVAEVTVTNRSTRGGLPKAARLTIQAGGIGISIGATPGPQDFAAGQTRSFNIPFTVNGAGSITVYVSSPEGLEMGRATEMIAIATAYESFVNRLSEAKDYNGAYAVVKDFAQAARNMLISGADYSSLYSLYLHLPLRQQYASLYDFYTERLAEANSYSAIMAVMYDFTQASREGLLSAEDYFKLYTMYQNHPYWQTYGIGSTIY